MHAQSQQLIPCFRLKLFSRLTRLAFSSSSLLLQQSSILQLTATLTAAPSATATLAAQYTLSNTHLASCFSFLQLYTHASPSHSYSSRQACLSVLHLHPLHLAFSSPASAVHPPLLRLHVVPSFLGFHRRRPVTNCRYSSTSASPGCFSSCIVVVLSLRAVVVTIIHGHQLSRCTSHQLSALPPCPAGFCRMRLCMIHAWLMHTYVFSSSPPSFQPSTTSIGLSTSIQLLVSAAVPSCVPSFFTSSRKASCFCPQPLHAYSRGFPRLPIISSALTFGSLSR